jgi:phosphocarrier protein
MEISKLILDRPLTARRPGPARRSEGTLTRTFVLRNRLGLHCRAAAHLAETLRRHGCVVTVSNGDSSSDGRDILSLLSLAAGYGARLTFRVTGKDAPEAMHALEHLFESNFAGAYPPGTRAK